MASFLLHVGLAWPKTSGAALSKTRNTALRLPARWETYFIVGLGNRTNTLEKTRSPKLNSIDWFASWQGFFSHPAFFENAKRWHTTPDQEILLLDCETNFIVGVDVRENALAKTRSAKLHSIDWFAPWQGFFDLLVFGAAFSLVFACYLLVGTAES